MKPKPSFLDLSFPDDDDDEEYRPTLEELEVQCLSGRFLVYRLISCM